MALSGILWLPLATLLCLRTTRCGENWGPFAAWMGMSRVSALKSQVTLRFTEGSTRVDAAHAPRSMASTYRGVEKSPGV